jgi:predicted HTH transcriptional regulator
MGEPFPKNPHIAQIFAQMGRSEELGTGVRKVYKYSKSYAGRSEIEFLEQDIFITKIPLDTHFFELGRNENIDNGGINDLLVFIKRNRQGPRQGPRCAKHQPIKNNRISRGK